MEEINLPDCVVFARVLYPCFFDDFKNFVQTVLKIPASITENDKGIKQLNLSVESLDFLVPLVEDDTLIVSRTRLSSNLGRCVDYVTVGKWHVYIIRPHFVKNLIASFLLIEDSNTPTVSSTVLDSLFKDYTLVGVENEKTAPLPSKIMFVHKDSEEVLYSVKLTQSYIPCP